MDMTDKEYFAHYGTPRHSGRYPWGSGDENNRNRSFLGTIEELKREGLSDKEIYDGLGMTSTQFRARKSIAKNEQKQSAINDAQSYKNKGMSNVAIGEKMGLNESSVRSLLAPGQQDKLSILNTTSNMLRDHVEEKLVIDIGGGVENQLGISKEKLGNAVAVLEDEGYIKHQVKVTQVGTGKQTTVKVLAKKDQVWSEIVRDPTRIKQIQAYSNDDGKSFSSIQPPINVDSNRLNVKYAEQGGSKADGVIYVRPGAAELSLGGSRYAQVRIAVDGSHYIKGMAMYKSGLPEGVDLQFNTNKSDTGDKLDALKEMNVDPKTGKTDQENPFGSIVRQIPDPETGNVASAMNIVNEEGDWDDWSRNLSTQLLSKQSPSLAKNQLNMTYEQKQAEFDEIMSLTNPAVKKKLLDSFSDDVDSSAVHLKAAHLPRQRTQVILPINAMKPDEIYAPNFRDGEQVVLVRYPHGGTFEIPQLTVNNKQPTAKRSLGNAVDAVGINSEVAELLSGADFDGDSVLVIPNGNSKIKRTAPLESLKDFNPQSEYKGYEGMPKMDARTKGMQMGQVSNLITDMTIKGASNEELARAVRHSMVVIDAEKHNLNYKQSAIDHTILALKERYQTSSQGGASTLFSRAKSPMRVRERKQLVRVDPKTGKKIFTETGASYTDKSGKLIIKTDRSEKLAETEDAHTLSSKTPIEKVYADHSNKLKSLANTARKASVNTKTLEYSPSAKVAYSSEVSSLVDKLNRALKNRPLERNAQILAGAEVRLKRESNPGMDAAELKKIKGMAIVTARLRTGAGKELIDITPQEWNAIQAGAISNSKLVSILNNTDVEKVKKYATPKSKPLMTGAKISRARGMLASGYTQAEVADALGVSISTLTAEL